MNSAHAAGTPQQQQQMGPSKGANDTNEGALRAAEQRYQEEELAALEAHLLGVVWAQLGTIQRLRRHHRQMVRIAADTNALCEVFDPAEAIAVAGKYAGGAAGNTLLTPPCCENGPMIEDLLFGRISNRSKGRRAAASTAAVVSKCGGNASDKHETSSSGRAVEYANTDMQHGLIAELLFAPLLPAPPAASAAERVPPSAQSLHDHIMRADAATCNSDDGDEKVSIGIGLFADSALHDRLVRFAHTSFATPQGDGVSGEATGTSGAPAPSEMLQRSSFLAILPLCAQWLLAVGAANTLNPSMPPEAHHRSTLQKAEAAFVLVHEGIRQFQPQSIFSAVTSRSSVGAPLWPAILSGLRQCSANQQFMGGFAWGEALADLIACLTDVVGSHGRSV